MKLIAVGGNVICEPYEVENSNGLILQKDNNDNMGKIVKADIQYANLPYMPYKVGDIIVYKKDDTIEFNLNGKKYIAVDTYDICAVIKEENE